MAISLRGLLIKVPWLSSSTRSCCLVARQAATPGRSSGRTEDCVGLRDWLAFEGLVKVLSHVSV